MFIEILKNSFERKIEKSSLQIDMAKYVDCFLMHFLANVPFGKTYMNL